MREVCNTGVTAAARKEKRGEWTSPRSIPASECWMVVFTDGSRGGARNGDSCGLHPTRDGTSGGCAGMSGTPGDIHSHSTAGDSPACNRACNRAASGGHGGTGPEATRHAEWHCWRCCMAA
jgi:hypothetical protein